MDLNIFILRQGGWGFVYGALFIALYHNIVPFILSQWKNSDYAFCVFVPFIAAYLFWERKQAFSAPSQPSWQGIWWVMLGLLLYLLGELGGEYYSIFVSSWLVLLGLLWLHWGWCKLRKLIFPVCFLLAMFPFPNVVNNSLSLHLKLISSKIGVLLMHYLGISVFRSGNVIDLGFTRLEVVEACSGLRYLLPMIIVGILIVAQKRLFFWQRALIVVLAVPFSILINSVRIALIAVLYPLLGKGVVDGAWHDVIGWELFMVSIGLMLGCQFLLARFFPYVSGKTDRRVVKTDAVDAVSTSAMWGKVLVAVLLMLASLGITQERNFRAPVELAKPFSEFPMQFNDWQGRRMALGEEYLRGLSVSDYLLADYSKTGESTVSVYVAYNASQGKGKSTHSPATCLPGSGWVFQQNGIADLPVGEGGKLELVKRVLMVQNGDRMLGYYWFPQRGRILTNIAQMKWYTFLDALTIHRTDGALVRILTPVKEGESIEVAENRLQGFVRLVAPWLNQFLPGR
nr:VPLPA-CTERM-specific exosortase XrtD [uncultured Desulfobulbus sp.]